jgi:hypothetical protein
MAIKYYEAMQALLFLFGVAYYLPAIIYKDETLFWWGYISLVGSMIAGGFALWMGQ